MFYNCKIQVPKLKGKVYRKKNKDSVYIHYEYDTVYFPEKKYNIPKRTTIGKVCEDNPDLMYPNANFVKYFPDAEIPQGIDRSARSCCLKIGSYMAIRKVVQDYGLDEMLDRIIGRDSGLFLDLTAYSIVSESNAAQYYPDYAYCHPLFTQDMKIYSDAKVSQFLNEMTRDQSIGFLNEWNEKRNHREKIYISYDSTNKSCQAGDIALAESGHSKEGLDLPVINYSVAYDKKNREPLFYEEYPGSIVDVSQLQHMLEKAKGFGYRRVGFILDRGYFSKENIRFMDRNNYDFVIMIRGMRNLVSELVAENRNKFEDVRSYHIAQFDVNGITVKKKLFESDDNERFFHIYYSTTKHAAERKELEGRIDRMSAVLKSLQGQYKTIDSRFERYFELIYSDENTENQMFLIAKEKEDVVEREIRLCGYFCIITSEDMTAKDAIMLYKSRDASEKLFRGDKSYLGNKSFRVQSDESVQSKIFIEFVGLIIRNRIFSCLKDSMVNNDRYLNYMTVPAVLKELDKIEMVRLPDNVYRVDHAVTAVQKTILKALGIDALYIKEAAKYISKTLAGKEQ